MTIGVRMCLPIILTFPVSSDIVTLFFHLSYLILTLFALLNIAAKICTNIFLRKQKGAHTATIIFISSKATNVGIFSTRSNALSFIYCLREIFCIYNFGEISCLFCHFRAHEINLPIFQNNPIVFLNFPII